MKNSLVMFLLLFCVACPSKPDTPPTDDATATATQTTDGGAPADAVTAAPDAAPADSAAAPD